MRELLGLCLAAWCFWLVDSAVLLAQSKEVGADLKGEFPAAVLVARGKVNLEGRIQYTTDKKFSDPLVYSGNKIYVEEGEAQLQFLLGGTVNLCSGTRFGVVQNHSPYIFALDRGSVTFDLPDSRGDTFFTPDFLVLTEAELPGQKSSFRGEISLEPGGSICIHSIEGKLRVATQDQQGILSLPAGSSIRLTPGAFKQELSTNHERCSCSSNLFRKEKQDLLMSFRAQKSRRFFFNRFGSFLRRALHVITLGIA